MFLVVGQRGSEARLVAEVLDQHPELTVVGGSEVLLPMAFLLERVSDPEKVRGLAADLIVADRGFAGGIGRHLQPEDVAAALAAAPLRLGPFLAPLYAAVAVAAGTRQAGCLLGVLGHPVLNRTGLYEGETRLIHVVRDVRSVVAELEGHQTPVEAARQWNQANRLFHQRRGGDPRTYRLVRYEDFVARPERSMAELASLLEVTSVRGEVTPPTAEPSLRLDPATRSAVVDVAREGLFDFGYDPPRRSPRRAVGVARRKLAAASDRAERVPNAMRARAWARRAPVPWAPESGQEIIATAACNVCRWTGESFAGHRHAESADCPRCGCIARERFHLQGLGATPAAEGLELLETAPRLEGGYGRAMRRWFRYTALSARPPGSPLGHLAGLADLGADSLDRVLCAHDLQSVPDPDAVLGELRRVLRPGGVALIQVPVLAAKTTAVEVAATAPAGTVRWSFGADVVERIASAGFVADLLVTDELAEVVADGAEGWAKAEGSGEVELDGVLGGLAEVSLVPVADRPSARRRGWLPGVLFLTVRAQKG